MLQIMLMAMCKWRTKRPSQFMTCFPQLTSQPTNLASSSNVFHEVCDPCSCYGKFISSTIIQILLITKYDIWQQVNVLEKPRDHRVVDHELDCSWYKTYRVYCLHETMWRLCITGFHRNKPYNTWIVTFFPSINEIFENTDFTEQKYLFNQVVI